MRRTRCVCAILLLLSAGCVSVEENRPRRGGAEEIESEVSGLTGCLYTQYAYVLLNKKQLSPGECPSARVLTLSADTGAEVVFATSPEDFTFHGGGGYPSCLAWEARAMQRLCDGTVKMLWTRRSTGESSIWTMIGSPGALDWIERREQTCNTRSPGWGAYGYAKIEYGPDAGKARLMWFNPSLSPSAAVEVWPLKGANPPATEDCREDGPTHFLPVPAGFVPTHYTRYDNELSWGRLLLADTDSSTSPNAQIWQLDGSDHYVPSPPYIPPSPTLSGHFARTYLLERAALGGYVRMVWGNDDVPFAKLFTFANEASRSTTCAGEGMTPGLCRTIDIPAGWTYRAYTR